HGATPRYAHDPAAREEGACDGCAERSGEMIAALAPIQTWFGEGASAMQRLRLDVPLRQQQIAVGGDLKRLLVLYQHAAIEQRLCQRDAKRPREVIVAGASEAHRLDLLRLAQRARPWWPRDDGEGFQRGADTRIGDAVVPTPAHRPELEDSPLDEPGEMFARGLRCDTRASSKLPGGQCHPAKQRAEHRCARWLA